MVVSSRTLLWGVSLALTSVLAWQLRGSDWLQREAPRWGVSSLTNPSNQATSPASSTGLRKCLRGQEAIYTDRPCPAGSQQQVVDGGTVNVTPRQPPTWDQSSVSDKATPGAPGSTPGASGDAGDLRAQAIERVVNR